MSDIDDLRRDCAARVTALADALRAIPAELAPSRRASLYAIREQIYFGWEQPLARAGGASLVFGKYERDGWWSEAAADLVIAGNAAKGQRQLERDHVNPVGAIAADLLAVPRTVEETEHVLVTRLTTCTVLPEEHRRLSRSKGIGWERYAAAGIAVRKGLNN